MSRGGCSRPKSSWDRSCRSRATLQSTNSDSTIRKGLGTFRARMRNTRPRPTQGTRPEEMIGQADDPFRGRTPEGTRERPRPWRPDARMHWWVR
eukprot:gene2419-biopygen11454